MKNFNIKYDLSSDDLFVYLDGAKSSGAVEAGNFIFDFDEAGNLIAMEIIDASKIFSSLLHKNIKLDKLKEFKAESTKFRNMHSVRFIVEDDAHKETASILVPHIIENSPSLCY